jgi:hypothetical protein
MAFNSAFKGLITKQEEMLQECAFNLTLLIRHAKRVLTRICLSRRLSHVTLEFSRAECNIDVNPGTLTAKVTCIGYHVTGFEVSRKVILLSSYESTCVGAGGGRGRGTKIKTKANRCVACYLTCDKYKSSLRHIHDPVHLSLKMKGIRFLIYKHHQTVMYEISVCIIFLRDEMTGEWRKLHNEELNDLYSLPNIVRVVKL